MVWEKVQRMRSAFPNLIIAVGHSVKVGIDALIKVDCYLPLRFP